MTTIIILAILFSIIVIAYILSKTETPVYLDGNNQPITSQDGLEDVVTDENTIYVKQHKKDRVKKIPEEVIEATTITTDDFVEKGAPFDEKLNYNFDKKQEIDAPSTTEDFQKTVVGAQLTEHISKVIELNPDSKKHLNRRQRKIVDKIVDKKK